MPPSKVNLQICVILVEAIFEIKSTATKIPTIISKYRSALLNLVLLFLKFSLSLISLPLKTFIILIN